MGTLGMGLLPVIAPLNHLFEKPFTMNFPRSSPELQGISTAGIRQFIAAANASGLGWHSFMLLRHGQVVTEGWWKPFEPSFTHTLYSLSKSFTSTAIGLLVKAGKLDIEAPVISFFPDETPTNPDAYLQKMKVKHLLTMNTGHATDTMPHLRDASEPWTKTFLAQKVLFEPGSHFLYNTGATYMLGAILHKITGETLSAYLQPRLFEPLEIKGYDWELSPQGLNTAGYGLRVKTEDIAKLGQLYLQKGKWKGKEILTEAWVNAATSFQTKSQEGNGDWSVGYGYQFWRCKPGFYRGDGAYGQYCIVMPQYDAVMAVTSESWDMQKSMTVIWENLLPAFHDSPLPENKNEQEALNEDLKNLIINIPKGSTITPLLEKYNGKTFNLQSNDFNASTISFEFSKKGCKCTCTTNTTVYKYHFGWESWVLNKEYAVYAFPITGRLHMPSKLAGTATWINDNTLQLNARFVDAIHGDCITCRFEAAAVTISFMNSISGNSKTDMERRKPMVGNLQD